MSERVLPIQVIDECKRRNDDTGERKLLVAILVQAMRDFIDGSDEAGQWFLSQEARPGSLRWICDCLEIDHEVFVQWAHQAQRTGWGENVRLWADSRSRAWFAATGSGN